MIAELRELLDSVNGNVVLALAYSQLQLAKVLEAKERRIAGETRAHERLHAVMKAIGIVEKHASVQAIFAEHANSIAERDAFLRSRGVLLTAAEDMRGEFAGEKRR